MLHGTLKDGGGLGVSGPAGDHHGPRLLRHGLHHLCLQPGKSAVNFATNWTSSCSRLATRQVSGLFVTNFGFNLVSTYNQASQLFILQQTWAPIKSQAASSKSAVQMHQIWASVSSQPAIRQVRGSIVTNWGFSLFSACNQAYKMLISNKFGLQKV